MTVCCCVEGSDSMDDMYVCDHWFSLVGVLTFFDSSLPKWKLLLTFNQVWPKG
jgi:hypothetical protein